MPGFKKYYEDFYIEIDVGVDGETILGMVIYHLNRDGTLNFNNRLNMVVDWYTPKHLVDLAIEVLDTGFEI
jgi:hypothetical protein